MSTRWACYCNGKWPTGTSERERGTKWLRLHVLGTSTLCIPGAPALARFA